MEQRKRLLALVPWTVLVVAVLLTRSDEIDRSGQRQAAIGQFGEAEPATVRVVVRGNAYVPARLEVTRGTTVVWTNEDPLDHTVTATNRSWDSGTLARGGSYSRRFDRSGVYSFYSLSHPNMTGVVVVQTARASTWP